MSNEFIQAVDTCDAGLVKGSGHSEMASVSGYYTVECFDASGKLKWKDEIHNLVTTAGKNKVLDWVLGNTAGGAVVMGLKGTGTAVVGDTQGSHASWTEVGTNTTNDPGYSGNRPTPAFAVASGGSKATSTAVSFTFTSSGTVAGCFINIGGSATKHDTTGTLFSAGDFSGGSKTVASTDVLNVTYTATVA